MNIYCVTMVTLYTIVTTSAGKHDLEHLPASALEITLIK